MKIWHKPLWVLANAVFSVASIGVFSSVAKAADLSYLVSLDAGHSDNIRRATAVQESENIAAAGLQFAANQLTPKLRADLLGDFAYNKYLNNSFDSELIGNFIADARFMIIPQRLEWIFEDNFGQVLGDPFSPVTPDNRENINHLSTGPDLTVALGSLTRLRLSGRYIMTTYERSEIDSQAVAEQVALIRVLSASSSLAINGRLQQLTYEDAALNADYDQSDGFLRYEVNGARTILGVDVGYTEIDRKATSETMTGLLLRLDVSRRVSRASRISINAGREFSASGTAFSIRQNLGGVDLNAAPGRQSVQPFINDFATLSWDLQSNRTAWGVIASWAEHIYEDNRLLDQTLITLGSQIRREISPRTSAAVVVSMVRADFNQPGGDYVDTTAGGSLTWRLSKSLQLILSYDHFDHSGDFVTNDYNENRVWLSIGYGRGTPRSSRSPATFGVDSILPGT